MYFRNNNSTFYWKDILPRDDGDVLLKSLPLTHVHHATVGDSKGHQIYPDKNGYWVIF